METKKPVFTSENKPNDQKKIKTLTVVLTATVIVLVVLTGVLTWLLFDKQKEAEKLEVVTNEKIELIEQFQNLSNEYELLKTDNDSMNILLEKRQEDIERVIAELNRTRVTNAAVINQYRKELGTLREVLRSYIVQVDSLNQANIALREENVRAREHITKVETRLQEEIKTTEQLTAKVQLGSIIVAENLVALPINQRGRDVTRIGRVDKIQVCFTLNRNAIAPAGERTVFLRIIRPDDIVLTTSAENLFSVNNEPLVFSASRNVIYENVDIEMCIFWTNDGSLIPGNYTAEIYTDGALLGTTNFTLKQ